MSCVYSTIWNMVHEEVRGTILNLTFVSLIFYNLLFLIELIHKMTKLTRQTIILSIAVYCIYYMYYLMMKFNTRRPQGL